MRRLLGDVVAPLVLALALFAGLVYFMFPTGTWLEQREAAAEVDQELLILTGEQARLREEISRVRTPEEIERIARRDFSLVRPGEEAFALLPAPAQPITIPPSWPFSILYDEVID